MPEDFLIDRYCAWEPIKFVLLINTWYIDFKDKHIVYL